MATNPKPSTWTHEREQALTHLWATDMTILSIADALGVTSDAVMGKADRLGLPTRNGLARVPRRVLNAGGYVRRPKRRATPSQRSKPKPATPTENKKTVVEDVRIRASDQYASIMHLVDLKRAGHSPRQTELRIPTGSEV